MMREINVENIPKESTYKDVVIIGNGPSGLSLSYMLAGNWPYLNMIKIDKHPDEMLRVRLGHADNNRSLVEQDLCILAEGLEGRSTNPVSLLLDSLEHPCADLGMELPSMLDYKFDATREIDHVVLGRGLPGGSWQKMDPNLRTLSLAGWMSLPGLGYSTWEQIQKQKSEKTSPILLRSAFKNLICLKCLDIRKKQMICNEKTTIPIYESFNNNNESELEAPCCTCSKKYLNNMSSGSYNLNVLNKNLDSLHENKNVPLRRRLSLIRQISKEVQTRAIVSRIAEYYKNYVHLTNLDRFFMNNASVMLLAPISESCVKQTRFRKSRWIVAGINESTGRPFYYACQNVVLANGVSDLANRLGLKGELGVNRSWVKHELRELESALKELTDIERTNLKPVLIVGAGLSAADAVTICRSSGISVIHVYRSNTVGLDKILPKNIYPEYHEVHKMMKDQNQTYNFYTPVSGHSIYNFSTNLNGEHRVTVQNSKTPEFKTFEVSYCGILIGARPDFRFLGNISNNLATTSTFSARTGHAYENQAQLNRKFSWLKRFFKKWKCFSWSEQFQGLITAEKREICNIPFKKFFGTNTILKNNKLSTFCQINGSGIGLGVKPNEPIDSKINQIEVNKYTNEVQSTFRGIYAMGPLVGDNFVRFIPGGALAITSALHKEND